MKTLNWALLFSFIASVAFADVKISQLPLKAANTTGPSDSIPFVNATLNETDRVLLSDLIHLPSMAAQFTLMIPTQTGNGGKFLKTDGTITSWSVVDSLQAIPVAGTVPNDADVLKYNATSLQWEPQPAAATGANTTLSNLDSPTAINQSLLTDGTPGRNIGNDSGKAFGGLFLTGGISEGTSGIEFINIAGRYIDDIAGTPTLDFSDTTKLVLKRVLAPDADGSIDLGEDSFRYNQVKAKVFGETSTGARMITDAGSGLLRAGSATSTNSVDFVNRLLKRNGNISVLNWSGSTAAFAGPISSSQVTTNAYLINGSSAGTLGLRFLDSDASNYVELVGPTTVSTDVVWTLPDADGLNGQFIKTDGAGTLGWASATASPGGANTNVQYNNGGAFDGNAKFKFDGDIVTIDATAAAPLRVLSSNTVTEMAIGTTYSAGNTGVATWHNTTSPKYLEFHIHSVDNLLNLRGDGQVQITGNLYPTVTGSSGQFLQTDGAGTASWQSISGANTALSNLTTTSINANLDPDTANSRSMGDLGNRWATITAQNYQSGVAGQYIVFTGSGAPTKPSGSPSGGGIWKPFQGGGSSSLITVFTENNADNVSPSGSLFIDSGNNTGTAGTGSIRIRPGMNTGGGTKGSVVMDGHVLAGSNGPVSPAVSACGTSPSIVGFDLAGRITVGTGSPTSCTITFDKPYSNAPICIVQNETTSTLLKPTPSTTALVITGTFTDGDAVAYHCLGYE